MEDPNYRSPLLVLTFDFRRESAVYGLMLLLGAGLLAVTVATGNLLLPWAAA